MCSSALVIAGVQVASGAYKASSQVKEGLAAQSYYNYLAKQNEQQAEIAMRTGAMQSRVTQDVAKEQGRRLKSEQAEFGASQKAALASAGVPLSSVTAGDIQKNTLSKQALDEATLRYNADIASYEAEQGAANQAYGLRSEAGGFRLAGKQSAKAGRRNAFGSLLGTAASVAALPDSKSFLDKLFKKK